MDDALMGAMTDVTDNVQMGIDFTGISCRSFTTFFSPLLLENFNWLSANSDGVIDRLPDGSTDESNDVWMEGNFPMNWTFRKFCTAIVIAIFTMDLADGLMDGTEDGHTTRWTEFMVESHLG